MKIKILKDCKWLFNASFLPSCFNKNQIYDLSSEKAEMLVKNKYAIFYQEEKQIEGIEQKMHLAPENKMINLNVIENKVNTMKKRGRPKKK